jgi:hypothetical protein
MLAGKRFFFLYKCHITSRFVCVPQAKTVFNKMIIAAFSPAKARAKVCGNVGYKALF